MADKKPVRRIKKTETVRERTERKNTEPAKPRRVRKIASGAKKPISAASNAGRKEYHPIKLPNNKAGRVLGRRVRFVPKYFREAWAEIKQVQWPNRRETTKLSIAVIVFAVVLGGLVWVLDYGLDKLFREIILG